MIFVDTNVFMYAVGPVEGSDVLDGRNLRSRHPGLRARDLLHLAVCVGGATGMLTYDRSLAAAGGR